MTRMLGIALSLLLLAATGARDAHAQCPAGKITKYELAQMLTQGGGAIANTTSTAGVGIGSPFRSAYAASKAGIVSLTKGAALEYAEQGVRVNALCPSHARTPLFFGLRPDLEARFISETPMGRIAVPEEIAEAALWLCSDASSFVTGHVLIVDGGYVTR